MIFSEIKLASCRYEKDYIFDKTLFANKVSSSFNFFWGIPFLKPMSKLEFEDELASTVAYKFDKFIDIVRDTWDMGFLKRLKKFMASEYTYAYNIYSFDTNLTEARSLSVIVFFFFHRFLRKGASLKFRFKPKIINEVLIKHSNFVIFYEHKFLYRTNLVSSVLAKNFFMFISNLRQQKRYTNFFFKFFFDFNKNLQKIMNNSVDHFLLQRNASLFIFAKTLELNEINDMEFHLDLILKNYKYLKLNLENYLFSSHIKKKLIYCFFNKILKLFAKYGVRKNFNFFLTKLKYTLFIRKTYKLFFKTKRNLKPFFLKKFNGFFKPLLKQYYKRYGRRYKRRPNGRIRMWHLFFLRNKKRKKKKKQLVAGHRKRFESWLIKTRKFIHLRNQVFHKQIIKYIYLNNFNIAQFKGFFKTNQLSNNFMWNTFRLRIIRYGPNNIVKNIVRYNKYNLRGNLYLRQKFIKGRLANFFWRRSQYLKKNFFLNIDRNYKRLINFALDCLAPAGFMGAFRVKRQKKVLKRSFITKNYRRYFLGAKLLVSLSKKNKRMADVEKLAFRIWHLWRFVNCGKKPKYFRDTLQKYYKPFSSVKSNQRLWKWRYVSDRGTIFKYFYW